MPFSYVRDGQKKEMKYNPKLAKEMKDTQLRSAFVSGYYTQTDIRACVLDPEETTLAFLLPPAEAGFDAELTTNSGMVYKGKGSHEGSLYCTVKREGSKLRQNFNGKRIEVRFEYSN